MEVHIKIWNQCLNVIKNHITENIFHTWFLPIIPLRYENNNFTIQTPNQFFYEYLEEKYAKLILQSLFYVIGKQTILNYRVIVSCNLNKKKEKNISLQNNCLTSSNQIQQQITKIKKWHSNLNFNQTFQNFFESESNKVTYSIAQKISLDVGKDFNPYFIYGVPGVGKTHLCHAIGNKTIELHPQKKVLYIPAHLFQIQFTNAIRKSRSNEFIYFYQGIDALILDDIHELAGKAKTLQAYFHIFNHLRQLGKQLVLTADKIPSEITGLEERLTSRLKWGLTLELQKPDLDLRKKILQYKIEQEKLIISKKIVDFIAETVSDNVRDLEGVVTALIAYSKVNNYEINSELVQKIISKIVQKKNKQITLEKIQNTVSSFFKIDITQIHSKSRKQEIVQARQIIMFLSKKYLHYSYSFIGKIIGKRDHTTVLHACNIIQRNLDENKKFLLIMKDIEALLV